ncbi:hypothetical protein [Eubacterium ramulus]|uniref:hypothetical protein n=1 Tax=Eubacterium ramulus TaxID=39490 RepID=UPI00399B54D7
MNEVEFEQKLNDELDKIQSVKTKTIKLDWMDKLALSEYRCNEGRSCEHGEKEKGFWKRFF